MGVNVLKGGGGDGCTLLSCVLFALRPLYPSEQVVQLATMCKVDGTPIDD